MLDNMFIYDIIYYERYWVKMRNGTNMNEYSCYTKEYN